MIGEAPRALLVLARNEPNRRLIREVLQKMGYAVVDLDDPGDVAERLTDTVPTLAVVDIDGYGDLVWTACKALTDAGVPVVVLTAQRNTTVQDRTLKLGVRTVLEKPVRKANIRAIVASIAGKARVEE